jgi:hypothetical protein
MERLVAEWALPVDVDRPPSPRGPRMERFLGRAAGSSWAAVPVPGQQVSRNQTVVPTESRV